MHDLALADAARPTPARILKLRMEPYSIGHELLLIQQRNPIILSDSEFAAIHLEDKISSVMDAALICSRNWNQNQSPAIWTRYGLKLIHGQDVLAEVVAFRDYRAVGSSFPKVMPSDDPGSTCVLGGPFLARLIMAVASVWQPVMDCPLSFAQHLFFAESERRGECRIEGFVENLVQKQVDEMTAQIHKEHAERAAKEKEATCLA